MTGGQSDHPVKKVSSHCHGRQQQTLGHGGAGAIKSQMGDPGVAQRKGGADTLIQKIPGKHQVEICGINLRFFGQRFQSQLLHFPLCLFPGFLAEFGIRADDIKQVAKRTFSLFFSCHTCPVGDGYRSGGPEGSFADLILCQITSLISEASMCRNWENTLYFLQVLYIMWEKELSAMFFVRKARTRDMDEILAVYAAARRFMQAHDNPDQWKDGHPKREILEEDIAIGQLYVVVREEEICGVFAFIPGIDPTYGYIEGAWHHGGPYAAIHRVASNGKAKGVLAACVAFCAENCAHLRIDTHNDNYVMQKALAKLGFARCGIIYLENGDPRIAFDRK